ncbi:DUF4325 domain-containing protein [Leptospira noumeaensis]|uniref:DUF4325 domain-containing protein n=1 Tax=Leptospira noumeaensis TaxID=2484964 RepID=A0A4R9IGP2_9LEPT|nr:DUF4325 domain-containing protein [Leptospira noumeaensis]TGK87577.1 DUF4325 domain-containing protein [Leptospira noumeaensis]
MKSKENKIYLEDYRAKGKDGNIAKVFTGRDRGMHVRTSAKLDELENKFSEIEIIIPDNIYSINPSFFEELFINVVLKLGKDEFRKKFKFTSEGEYNHERALDEAIARILRRNSALG